MKIKGRKTVADTNLAEKWGGGRVFDGGVPAEAAREIRHGPDCDANRRRV